MEILPILEMTKSIVNGHPGAVTFAAMVVVRNPATNITEEFQKWKQPLTYEESNDIKIKLDLLLNENPELIQRDIKIKELKTKINEQSVEDAKMGLYDIAS